jgi:sortase (surface protein transpeptidase)
MSMGYGGPIPDTDDRRRPVANDPEADAAALLSASRELIAEARRILAEPPLETDYLVEPVLYRSLLEEATPSTEPPGGAAHGLRRRLVALVPAAAGVVALGAGLAALTGNQTHHTVTLGSQRSPAGALAPSAPTTVASSQAAATAFEVPLSMSVPRLNSEATVAAEVYVQTSGPEAGLLDAPADYHQLGWYRHGDSGALVLDGHVGYRTNPGPLAFIGSLAPGDAVVVRYPSGDQTYSVTVVGKALKGQLPQDYFTDQYDGDLMLITCDYTSPFSAGHFADNVYVVAAPKE